MIGVDRAINCVIAVAYFSAFVMFVANLLGQ
jgi:hypothetical protein